MSATSHGERREETDSSSRKSAGPKMEGFLEQLHQLNASLSTTSPLISITMAAIFGVIAKVVLSLRRTLDFHNEYFVKKRIKRIAELKGLVKEGPLVHFLNQSLETEAFRIDTGIT